MDLVLAQAAFGEFERHVVPAGQVVERTPDDIVAWVFSRSESAPHLFGNTIAEFERELRALLATAAADGRFTEHPPPTEIMIWRTPRG